MAELTTRAGLTPCQKELPFEISTSMVVSYIQKKLDILYRKTAGENGKGENPIRAKVYTTEAGRDFLPFVVVLPMEASGDSRQENKMPNIFNTYDGDGTVKLRPEVYNLFKTLTYTKEDEDAFFSDDWRRRARVPRDVPAMLKRLRTPRIMKLDNGREEVISFMIDPIRVFYDMLKSTDPAEAKKQFYVEISNWKKQRTGEYTYLVKRVQKNGGKRTKYDGDYVANELNRRMRGGRGRR